MRIGDWVWWEGKPLRLMTHDDASDYAIKTNGHGSRVTVGDAFRYAGVQPPTFNYWYVRGQSHPWQGRIEDSNGVYFNGEMWIHDLSEPGYTYKPLFSMAELPIRDCWLILPQIVQDALLGLGPNEYDIAKAKGLCK